MESPIRPSEKGQAILEKILEDFSPDRPVSYVEGGSVRSHRFELRSPPHPEAPWVYFLLRSVLHFANLGRREKVAFEIPFRYGGVGCGIAHQKFGMRFYVSSDDLPLRGEAGELADEAMGRIRSALRLFERQVLQEIAEQQFRTGEVMVENQFGRLDNSFKYFREQAESRAGRAPPSDLASPEGLGEHLTREFRRRSEAFDYTIAAVNAFFSRLEHILVLLLPFHGFDARREDIRTVIGDKLGQKFRRLFDIADPRTKALYDRLHSAAEEYRNTYAHGGFDKAHASLRLHIPGIGAVQARVTALDPAPSVEFLAGKTDPPELWRLFDEVDAWLRQVGSPYGMIYVESGLPVRFDAASFVRWPKPRRPQRHFASTWRGLPTSSIGWSTWSGESWRPRFTTRFPPGR